MLGCPWQRCTVHFLRDMLGHCAKAQQPTVASAIRRIFAAEDASEARARLGGAVAALAGQAPKVARLLEARRGRPARLHGLPARALAQAAAPKVLRESFLWAKVR